MFADVTAAAHCDLLVSHAAMCATPLVAERRRIPWVSVALQPAIMWSVTDPPYMPIFGSFARTSPSIARALFRGVTWSTGRWAQGLYEFRRELGLSPVEKNPLFEGMFSPLGTLALFSPLFAPPQPDWPLNTTTTGFVFYDKLDAASSRLSAEMEDFLAAGSPPVVFTLGTSAVNVPGDFYKASASAVEKLGCRAILLTGRDMKGVEELSSSKVLCAGYAPYSLLLPRSAATVHSGGVGTTGQALRSGKPQIVMPFSHDQPDNGARVERMGVGAMIKRRRYRTAIVTETLERLLSDQRVTARACEVGAAIGAENGIQSAADALERFASTA